MLKIRTLTFVVMLAYLGLLALPGWGQTPASQAPGSKLPVSIFTSLPQESARVFQGFVSEFQETHPYLELTVTNFPQPEALYRELSTPGKAAPTMAIVETSWLPGLVQSQPDLYPVETWMPREQFGFSWAIKNNAYVQLWDASHVTGHLFALPMWFSTRALIYNSDAFEKAKIKQPPATWEQLGVVARQLTGPKSTLPCLSLGQPDDPANLARNFQMLVWQSGGEGLHASPAAEAAVECLKKLGPCLTPLDGEPSLAPLGMAIGTVEDYLKLRASGLPIKVAPIPGLDKNQRITETQCWALAVFRSVPERELYKVQELAFFLMDFQQQRRWAEQTPYLAAHLKVFDNPFYRQARMADHANLRVFLNSIGKSRIVDTSANAPQRYLAFGKMLGPLLRGEKTLTELSPTR